MVRNGVASQGLMPGGRGGHHLTHKIAIKSPVSVSSSAGMADTTGRDASRRRDLEAPSGKPQQRRCDSHRGKEEILNQMQIRRLRGNLHEVREEGIEDEIH